MFPLRPIRPPPEETASGSPSAHGKERLRLVRESDRKKKNDKWWGWKETAERLTGLVPEPHVFHAGCNELVGKVGINFDDKYLVLASPGVEKKDDNTAQVLL